MKAIDSRWQAYFDWISERGLELNLPWLNEDDAISESEDLKDSSSDTLDVAPPIPTDHAQRLSGRALLILSDKSRSAAERQLFMKILASMQLDSTEVKMKLLSADDLKTQIQENLVFEPKMIVLFIDSNDKRLPEQLLQLSATDPINTSLCAAPLLILPTISSLHQNTQAKKAAWQAIQSHILNH